MGTRTKPSGAKSIRNGWAEMQDGRISVSIGIHTIVFQAEIYASAQQLLEKNYTGIVRSF